MFGAWPNNSLVIKRQTRFLISDLWSGFWPSIFRLIRMIVYICYRSSSGTYMIYWNGLILNMFTCPSCNCIEHISIFGIFVAFDVNHDDLTKACASVVFENTFLRRHDDHICHPITCHHAIHYFKPIRIGESICILSKLHTHPTVSPPHLAPLHSIFNDYLRVRNYHITNRHLNIHS